MKQHHSIYLWLLPCLLLLNTACRENMEENIPLPDKNALQGVIADDAAVSRSIVIDNPGVRMESYWKGGDRIGVFGQGASNVVFHVADADILQDGKIANFKSAADIPQGTLAAYHPYSPDASANGMLLTLTMSERQTYTTVRGVVQPDPTACVMAGSGTKGGGISFHNIMAVLKIGQAFGEKTVVKKVIFRDLSGKPVSGTYTVDLANSTFATEFTGSGKDIILDMGEGVTVEEGGLGITFLVVPARHYPKGFEITFVDHAGKQTVRTVGTKQGKTLSRSVVYPIGDITNYKQVEGIDYELKPTARVMTPENLDLVKVASSPKFYVYTDDGKQAVRQDGTPLMMPQLTMRVHKDLNPVTGGWLIFNMPTSELPTGGVYKIRNCRPSADGLHYEVFATAETNFAAPFEELTIGKPMFDADGNILEEAGVELDLGSYLKEIRDGEGNVVATLPNRLPTYDMNAAEAMSRAPAHRTFTSPKLSLDLEASEHAVCNIEAQMSFKMRLAIGVMQGELQYIYQTVNPHLDLTATFALLRKFEKERRMHLIDLYFPGIAIGPVLVTPMIGFSGVVRVGGELKFSASANFNYDLGTYGLAYNRGDGLSFRKVATPPPSEDNSFSPQLDASASGGLYVFGGIGAEIGLSVYGLCSFGANTTSGLTFGLNHETNSSGHILAKKLSLTPGIEIKPYTALIGGRLRADWKGVTGKIEMDPLWERYITPKVSSSDLFVVMKSSEEMNVRLNDKVTLGLGVPMGVEQVVYRVALEGDVVKDIPIAVDVYRGTDIEFLPEPINGLYAFSDFQAAGIPHLYSYFEFCKARIKNPELVTRHIVDTYEAGQESEVIEGTCTIATSSGVPYAVRLVLMDGDKPMYLNGDPSVSGRRRHNFIYYWPNRANGQPY